MSEPTIGRPSAPEQGTSTTPAAAPTTGPAPSSAPAYGTPPGPGHQPGHQPGPGTPPLAGTQAPLSPADERTWAVAAHLSSFVAAYVALGLLGPLVVMLVAGPRSEFVRRHAVDALNFNLSVLIYLAVSGVLALVLIGIPMLVAVGVLYVVAVIRGAMAANRGEEYRYPLTIRFVR